MYFFESARMLDLEKMALFVQDSSALSSLKAQQKEWFSFFVIQAERISCEIKGATLSADTAEVTARCIFPDSSKLIQEVITDYFVETYSLSRKSIHLSPGKADEILSGIMDNHKSLFDSPLIERTLKIACIREKGKWLINSVTPEMGNVLTANFIETMNTLRQTMVEMIMLEEQGRKEKEKTEDPGSLRK